TYTLGTQRVTVDADRVVWSADRTHFVGSASTMTQCAAVLRAAGFSADETDALTRKNALAILG
ncbi:MAG: N-acetylglucosamine-6-phosphate deacetylase, partial [Spirochaetaceae bacterium]